VRFGTVPHLDRPVSRVVMGTDFLTGQPRESSFAALDAYWEAGGNVFDTATAYEDNSRVFGEWLASRGLAGQVIHLDKGCHPTDRRRVTRADAREDLAKNHEQIGVAVTDFFVLHRDDPDMAVGEVVTWLNELVSEGLIRAFGGSNWHHARIQAANEYAEANGLQGFSLSNPNLSLAIPNEPMWAGCISVDEDGRRWHERTGFPLFSWSSMARGFFGAAEDEDTRRVYFSEVNLARKARAEDAARRHGLTPPQIALAWVLGQPLQIFALGGLRTVDQVQQALEASEVILAPDEVHWLEHGE